MSQIYEALRKAGGPTAEIVRATLDGTRRLRPSASILTGRTVTRVPEELSATSRLGTLRLNDVPSVHVHAPVETAFQRPQGLASRAAEQYRIVRTKIALHPKTPRVLAISSPASGDGKTISALNIAGALAMKAEIEVLLVDADFRRASCSAMLANVGRWGLTDLLAGECSFKQAVARVHPFPNLYVLQAGTPRANASELLDSPQRDIVFETLRERFRFTIFDTPALGAVADYDILQDVCDGVLLVLRPDHTNRKLYSTALERVSPEKFLGVILNESQPWFLWKSSDDHHDYADSAPGSFTPPEG